MISSELPEVLGMADRVLVVLRVTSPPTWTATEATPETVMRAATPWGTTTQEEVARHERHPAGAPSRVSPVRRALTTVLRSREMSVAAVLLAVILIATLKSDSFLFSGNGWRDLLLTPSILILLAVGQTVVIITRNVDLSVGSILALTAYLTGKLFIDLPGIPIVVVFLAGIALGALLGLVNGVLVAFGKVPALVITLGTLYVYRGIVLSWAGSDRINASDMPGAFLRLGTQSILGIPVLTILALVVLAAVGYYLATARGGRELYAIGSDPDAADLYGLQVRRRVLTAFVLCGALAGLAGCRLHRPLRHGQLRRGARDRAPRPWAPP